MFLSIISFISILSVVIMPIKLSSNVNEESSALIFIPANERQVLGYSRLYKNIIDGISDDSGCVHILIKEEYTGLKLNWIYQKYSYDGTKMIDKILYSAEYGAKAYSPISARLLINPDMTILFIYPDNDFYTCWMKLNRVGDIIEENQPKWWRGDAKFDVCSAGQDSFHIISDPLPLWEQPRIINIPGFGEAELVIMPLRGYNLHYSNNFKLKEKRVPLRGYAGLGNYRLKMLSLPDCKIFCFDWAVTGDCYSWFVDENGECGATKDGYFPYESFGDKASCVISFEEYWSKNNLESWVDPSNVALGLSEADTSICVGITYLKHFYLVKYNIAGQIVRQEMQDAKFVDIDAMEKSKVFTCIEQQGSGAKITYTTYWGFDCQGNFFVEIY